MHKDPACGAVVLADKYFPLCAATNAPVFEGDTLSTIAERYNGISVDHLVELNQTEDGCLECCTELTGWENVTVPLGSKYQYEVKCGRWVTALVGWAPIYFPLTCLVPL
jgi:hypothetical protein